MMRAKVDRALRRAMFSIPGFAGILVIERRSARSTIPSFVIFPGSARALACRRWRLAGANFGNRRCQCAIEPCEFFPAKSVAARRRNQHAGARALPRKITKEIMWWIERSVAR